ncbi:UDP-2,3-diacylglucosamine diphosphatase [Sanguibacteroides justesenii]|uniref:UDP-2,3-diacylglucosamine hydrolase n=1 Tax=Sanguibacteroides justesenii TaxID=1547597 RepID=A0A0C3M8Q6_9PORP|nr:UDP-2,3-diacylglucosamine diphosphatase [Sanguibacteroides justesenii]KIO42813.1 UDP-2,3-diacylglucosamine hydrolase [Sanguibacteroides justesenii]PXZ44130.1 UDP-2,3-diacylglucosamine diphosphatase [Sanguibacteroides justesenii]
MQRKKVYFLSDAHLGAKLLDNNRERERKLVSFLEKIRPECAELYLLGDMFDFWFEYKRSVPKGHVRFLAELARYTDNGIKVHFFTGNHDIWAFDYLNKECGVILHTAIEETRINGKSFMIGHGDGLNPKDKGYLFLKRAFHNRFLQKCFRLIHPDWGIKLAHAWSSHSRLKDNGKIEALEYLGEDKEEIVLYCKQILQQRHFDYFIFGHRHIPIDLPLCESSRYINTGDWISHFSYAVFDGEKVELKFCN